MIDSANTPCRARLAARWLAGNRPRPPYREGIVSTGTCSTGVLCGTLTSPFGAAQVGEGPMMTSISFSSRISRSQRVLARVSSLSRFCSSSSAPATPAACRDARHLFVDHLGGVLAELTLLVISFPRNGCSSLVR